ncbi:MAG: S9 family peptidase [Planctomycetes bacterium]|nr:S9 family peptidase [Planctomycetota bacterium]
MIDSISGVPARMGVAVLGLVLVAGAAVARPTEPATSAGKGGLIPREAIFGNPDRSGTQMSHDGKYISYLAAVDGVMNIWVAPSDDLSKAKAITAEKTRGIRNYFWAFDNAHVLYTQDNGGDENWRVYAVDVTSGASKDLTPMKGVAAQINTVSEKFPNEVLVGLNNRIPQLHDVYRINIATGEKTLAFQNEGYVGITFDDNFVPRFGQKMLPDGSMAIDKIGQDGKGELFDSIPADDTLTTGMSGFDKTGNIVYVNDSRGRDTGALFARDLTTGKTTLIAEDSRADVGGTLVHPTQKTIQAVEFNYTRAEWKVLDKSIQADLDYLKTVADGEINIQSRTQDDKHWLVSFMMDNGPVRVYRYDRDEAGKPGKATFLFTNRKSLEGLALAKMHPQVITARDGMKLVSYLSLPTVADKDGNGKPDTGPVPMVLLVHGGPWARDEWGYNPYAQWLTNRGYAVLMVNFRGSTGFGKTYVNAGNREWAGKMHNDLIDAVDWAVKEKIADKSKVAIMGGSYGGYATLVGLTFTPDVFACGVDIVGPSNINTLLSTIPAYWAPMKKMFSTRVGDYDTEDGKKFLESKSPLTIVDKIKKPLLIGQGANDPRVKQAEADQIVAAMQAKNIPVTYVLFPDEGHGFARPVNSMAFNAVVEGFLAKNLGGAAQPIGDDLGKSTAQIKVGADFVPGLAEAVQKAQSSGK